VISSFSNPYVEKIVRGATPNPTFDNPKIKNYMGALSRRNLNAAKKLKHGGPFPTTEATKIQLGSDDGNRWFRRGKEGHAHYPVRAPALFISEGEAQNDSKSTGQSPRSLIKQ